MPAALAALNNDCSDPLLGVAPLSPPAEGVTALGGPACVAPSPPPEEGVSPPAADGVVEGAVSVELASGAGGGVGVFFSATAV